MTYQENEQHQNSFESQDLIFKYLPSFAAWIRQNKLEEYSRLMVAVSKKENIPLLKLFSHLTDDQMIQMGMLSGAELLQKLANNEARLHIDTSMKDWVTNRLLTIDRDAVAAEDIILISFVRRYVFRTLLDTYTSNTVEYRQLMEEVDRFTTASDIAAINAYISINQEKMHAMNAELNAQREELLEAQQLGKMGSFYWDMQGDGKSVLTPMVLEIFELEESGNMESFIMDVHPDDREGLKKAIDKALYNDGYYEYEYRYSRNNKNKRIWSRGIVHFEDGKPIGMKGTVMDTTMETELLEKLQASEDLHKQAQALTHIGNWSWDITTGEVTWSDEMYRVYGLEPQSEKINFERFISFVHPDYREARKKEIERSLQTGIAEDYLLHIVTPSGEKRILKGRGEIKLDSTGRPVRLNGTCQDITSEFRLNNALRQQEEYLALLINNAPDSVIVIDEKSIIRLWNPKSEQIFGWSSAEVLGKNLVDTIIPDKYREAHLQGMKNYMATGIGNIIGRTLELTANNNRSEELYISLTISETIYDGHRSFMAFIRDVTEERQTRSELRDKTMLLEQTNQELKHSNEELESFNYAASHDLQEPLRKIQIFADRVRGEGQDLSPKLQGYVEKIILASSRMQGLINDLLLFSQTTSADEVAEPVNMEELLTEVKSMLSHRIEETSSRISHGPLPVLRVVKFQFLQLFLNLISNAIKYNKPGVAPEINISTQKISKPEPGTGDRDGTRNYLQISIADNGIGFEPHFAEKLFELFTRLHNKEKYSGTGIGLAICKKIVQNHQGFITAESDGRHGSTFHIYIPEERVE